ncbi:hypothetical protein HQ531_13595 [bacterium]|nr:hypothetical protein [bacterium]
MIVRLLSVLLLAQILPGQTRICIVDHPPINEQSAIVKSRTYADVYWVSNDSDTEPYLFPLNSVGKIIIPDWMQSRYSEQSDDIYPGVHISGAILYDWESIAVLNDTLIVADVGNNGNARRDLGIYLIPEPNPHNTPRTRPLAWYPVCYEDQDKFPPDEWEYDCEAIFTFEGQIYFLTKNRADKHIMKPAPSTKLYRMDTRHTTQVNVLKFISRKESLGGWVTDADIAPDGSAMVLLAQNPLACTIWYFPRPAQGDDFLSESPKIFNLLKANQAEGICFKDSEKLIVTNEEREWFEVSLSKFSQQ